MYICLFIVRYKKNYFSLVYYIQKRKKLYHNRKVCKKKKSSSLYRAVLKPLCSQNYGEEYTGKFEISIRYMQTTCQVVSSL